MHNVFRSMVATLAAVLLCTFSQPIKSDKQLVSVEDLKQPIKQIELVENTEEASTASSPSSLPAVWDEIKNEIQIARAAVVVEEEPEETDLGVSESEIELLAKLVMAEAEGESEEGKRLVVDTVLNRVDHKRFPDTITDVIYQPGQFSCIKNGRFDRCYVQDDIVELVKEEIESRMTYETIFFRTGYYSSYGEPLYKVDNHYFSSYA